MIYDIYIYIYITTFVIVIIKAALSVLNNTESSINSRYFVSLLAESEAQVIIHIVSLPVPNKTKNSQ